VGRLQLVYVNIQSDLIINILTGHGARPHLVSIRFKHRAQLVLCSVPKPGHETKKSEIGTSYKLPKTTSRRISLHSG